MASTPNTVSTISAWLKEQYADTLMNLVPDGVKFLPKAKFKAGKELGDKYIQPLSLTHEFGFTHGTDGSAYSLKDAVNATYVEAQVDTAEIILRSQVSYGAAAKASSSKKSFVTWANQLVGNMTSSLTKRIEILCFYGKQSIGQIASISTNTLTLTDASWASGIWAGAEGVKIDGYDTKSGGSVQNSGVTPMTVASVDFGNKSVTVDNATGLAVGDFLYFHGGYASEQNGLDQIITNSGSLYNVSAATYTLWAGNSEAVGNANLTFAKIQNGVAKAVGKGLDGKVTLYCSPATYATLNTDLAAFSRRDNKYNAKKGENGYEAICFYSLNGEIEIVPSIYVKEGEAFAVPMDSVCRIGASDVTMKMPGMDDEELLHQLPSNAGYELRLFYSANLFVERPGHCVKFTGIVN